MAPHFGLQGEKKKKKKKTEGQGEGFSWFETTVNGGAVVLSVLKDAAAFAPLPYLRGAAATSLNIIQIAQVCVWCLLRDFCIRGFLFFIRRSRTTRLISGDCAKMQLLSPSLFTSPVYVQKIPTDGQAQDSRILWTASCRMSTALGIGRRTDHRYLAL